MKIQLLTTALVAIVGLAFIGAPVTASAQTATTATAPAAPSTAPKAKEKKKSEYTQFPKGSKLSALDATSATITTAKGDVKLVIDATTGFEVDKKKATAADFAVGDEVTGSYKASADGTNTAHNIRKKTPKK
jgi:hypothetical protein